MRNILRGEALRPCEICGKAIATVLLSGGHEAILHAEDFEALNLRHRLYRDVNRKKADGSELAYVRIRRGDRPGVRLHTLVAELHGVVVERGRTVIDHRNGNTLDNRWGCNLRRLSIGENNKNRVSAAPAGAIATSLGEKP